MGMQGGNFYLVYIDDSTELPYYAFSALAVPAHKWPQIFKTVKEWRSRLNEEYGIDTTKELHAWKFVSGRGKLAPQPISKWRRCEIFHQSLSLLASIIRKMSVHNPIPSRLGSWASGDFKKNITIDRIIEDPFFKSSEQSYFIQLADFCAYALLRKERPLPSKDKYRLHLAFQRLEPICVKESNPRDPYGIVR